MAFFVTGFFFEANLAAGVLATGFFGAFFLVAFFLTAGFLVAVLATAFLVAGLFVVFLLLAVFLATDFLVAFFRVVDVLLDDFVRLTAFAVCFFAAVFLVAGFLLVAFLAVDFAVTLFFVAFFFVAVVAAVDLGDFFFTALPLFVYFQSRKTGRELGASAIMFTRAVLKIVWECGCWRCLYLENDCLLCEVNRRRHWCRDENRNGYLA